MTFPFYTGNGSKKHGEEPVNLPTSNFAKLVKPEGYFADSGLVDACNVALLLAQPLLLTGEPGSGKTQFAYSLAWELNFGRPLRFDTKSTSTAKELFYNYDALKRFQDAQSGIDAEVLNYLNYNALGTAILQTRKPTEIAPIVPKDFKHSSPVRSIVLIDEIDKAPRDFPNDLLNELENAYFRVSELDNYKVEADSKFTPIVIITSNSEKDLPDAFLRRCAYYHIPFPSNERLSSIIKGRLGLSTSQHENSIFISSALKIFSVLRSPKSGLRKKPATAELLGWLVAMQEISKKKNPLEDPEIALRTLSSLIKTTDDRDKAISIVKRWMAQHK